MNQVAPTATSRWSVLALASLAAAFMLTANVGKAKAWDLWAGALGGYTAPTKDTAANPYGVGLGLNAGITLPVFPIYIGARGIYQFGTTKDIVATGVAGQVKTKSSVFGLDLGYDLSLKPIPLVIRPEIGFGNIHATAEVGGVSSSDDAFFVAPGVAAVVSLALLYVGAEVRYNIVTRDNSVDAVSLMAMLGLTI